MLKSGKLLVAAAIAFCAFSTVSANAATVIITPLAGAGNPNPVSVEFSGSVLGLLDGPAVSATAATGFLFSGNAAAAASLLNTIIGGSGVLTANGGNVDFGSLPNQTGNSEQNTFDVFSEYFAFKSGGWIAFFRNTSGVSPISVIYDAITLPTQNGAGLSHIVNLNPPTGPTPFDVPAVPLPASVWLFGTGLAGLSMLRRFRKRTADAA